LKQTPLDAIANYNLGAAEGKAGDVSSALEHLSKAVELDATLWQAWLNLGNAHFFLNRPDSAQYCYHKALSLAPDSPDILYNLGNFYLTQKDKVQAVEYLQKAYDLAPEYPNLKELLENLRQNQK
jgi:Flp pilus assembly protein TadD